MLQVKHVNEEKELLEQEIRRSNKVQEVEQSKPQPVKDVWKQLIFRYWETT